jgi:hypothetical protein
MSRLERVEFALLLDMTGEDDWGFGEAKRLLL